MYNIYIEEKKKREKAQLQFQENKLQKHKIKLYSKYFFII